MRTEMKMEKSGLYVAYIISSVSETTQVMLSVKQYQIFLALYTD